jgi:general stress protein 26
MRQSAIAGMVLMIVTGLQPLSAPVRAQGRNGAEIPRKRLINTARAIMTAARSCALLALDEAGRPQGRVMDAFPPDMEMMVWFGTNPGTRKVKQIERDPRVTLYYFDPRTSGYVTLLGRARLVDNPAQKKTRWKKEWEAFHPDRECGYLLIAVTPERIEVVSPKLGIEGDTATWKPPAVDYAPPGRKR